jgi:hypothetical protein
MAAAKTTTTKNSFQILPLPQTFVLAWLDRWSVNESFETQSAITMQVIVNMMSMMMMMMVATTPIKYNKSLQHEIAAPFEAGNPQGDKFAKLTMMSHLEVKMATLSLLSRHQQQAERLPSKGKDCRDHVQLAVPLLAVKDKRSLIGT